MDHPTAVQLAAAAAFATIVAGSVQAMTSGGESGASAAASATDHMSPPIVNWMAPQALNVPPGFTSTSPLFHGTDRDAFEKSELALSTFIPITPCRLVDTRGVFSPVYAGGPFTAGQTRVYAAAGNCGVPAGAGRIKAVSLAVTTPPTSASGDIEVIANGATLGHTVVMVIQAGQWNSATTVSAVDAAGAFKVQLRTTPGDVVIDINGYYAATSSGQVSDYFSISGNYGLGGGLFYVFNGAGAGGAAINAQNTSESQVSLAYGTNALQIENGGFKVNGAGAGTPTAVYVEVVDSTASGNICSVFGYPRLVLQHPDLDGNPGTIPVVGTSMYSYPGAGGGNDDWDPVQVQYFTASSQPCGGTNLQNHWSLVKPSGSAAFKNGHAYPVWVVKQ